MQREIITLGVSHHDAPVEFRERLAIDNADLEQSLTRLVRSPRVDEAVIVSTCNRVEVTAASTAGDDAVESLVAFLAGEERVAPDELRHHATVYRGREAVRHLFRVASSLDSMVVGEPQILGQLKASYEKAAAAGSAGTILHRCFHRSFKVAKRVRTETAIAGRAVSISSAAVELTTKIFDTLEDKTAMLIGAGQMSELAARHLLARGVRSLVVTNRTYERAVDLAREFRGTPVPFAEIDHYLPTADIVIGSTAADNYILGVHAVERMLQARRYQPIFLIDMSVPRNFEPAINELDGAYLYDIDDLGSVAESNRDERTKEAGKAEAIVGEEVEGFWSWLTGLDIVPTIKALRQRAEVIRQAEMERTRAALSHLSEDEMQAVEAMASALINKMLHDPISQLKNEARGNETASLATARKLFRLDPEG